MHSGVIPRIKTRLLEYLNGGSVTQNHQAWLFRFRKCRFRLLMSLSKLERFVSMCDGFPYHTEKHSNDKLQKC